MFPPPPPPEIDRQQISESRFSERFLCLARACLGKRLGGCGFSIGLKSRSQKARWFFPYLSARSHLRNTPAGCLVELSSYVCHKPVLANHRDSSENRTDAKTADARLCHCICMGRLSKARTGAPNNLGKVSIGVIAAGVAVAPCGKRLLFQRSLVCLSRAGLGKCIDGFCTKMASHNKRRCLPHHPNRPARAPAER